MPKTVTIDDALLAEAKTLGHHRTRRDAVHEALREYIQRRKRRKLMNLAGTIDFAPGWRPEDGRGKR